MFRRRDLARQGVGLAGRRKGQGRRRGQEGLEHRSGGTMLSPHLQKRHLRERSSPIFAAGHIGIFRGQPRNSKDALLALAASYAVRFGAEMRPARAQLNSIRAMLTEKIRPKACPPLSCAPVDANSDAGRVLPTTIVDRVLRSPRRTDIGNARSRVALISLGIGRHFDFAGQKTGITEASRLSSSRFLASRARGPHSS